MTPEQEDNIIKALRPLCPGQDPEQLRGIVRQVMTQAQSLGDPATLEAEILRRFPNLKTVWRKEA